MIECRADNLTYKCSHCNKWFQQNKETYYLKLYAANGTNENIAIFCSKSCKENFNNLLMLPQNNSDFKNVTSNI